MGDPPSGAHQEIIDRYRETAWVERTFAAIDRALDGAEEETRMGYAPSRKEIAWAHRRERESARKAEARREADRAALEEGIRLRLRF